MSRSLLCLMIMAACSVVNANPADPANADEPRHVRARVLRSDELRVEVMEPGAPDSYHRGNRFSPVANVLRVTLRGRDFLFSPVEHDRLLENAGLAMEFDLLQWPDGGPPGFAEAAVGEPFLKVGVGILRKAEGHYGFYKPYATLLLAPTQVEWERDRARFRQTCGPMDGYAYLLEAEVSVRGRIVEISYRLLNTGEKGFATEQYAHNYFLFEDAPVGPDYAIEFSEQFTVEKAGEPAMRQTGKRLELAAGISPGKAVNAKVVFNSVPADGESVLVRHKRLGMSVLASVSRPTAYVAIHAAPAYLCPEQFVRLRLGPGEEAVWKRTYEFNLSP